MNNTTGLRLVVAIGGNSLVRDAQHQRVEDQYACLVETCQGIAELVDAGHHVVITHGNGPQVGFILRRSELARHELHEVPLPSCIADTQGAIGFQIQQAMHTAPSAGALGSQVVTVVTQVIVAVDDPAFQSPSKPIGSYLDAETAERRRREGGWIVAEDGPRGWRRVVASPKPVAIVELPAIQALAEAGFIVVAAGGGGIPVVETPTGTLVGVDAVIDKDFASSLLAQDLDVDLLVISTATERVALRFDTADETLLDVLSVDQARKHAADGEFGRGSMLPKIEACVEFVERSGGEAVIADPPNLVRAVAGEAGTRIIP